MFRNFDLGVFLLAVLPVLLAITIREVVRGYTARYWGDNTAEQYGRLTLNPLPHIDLVGTVIFPLITLMFTPFLFGWARPIPYRFAQLPQPASCLAVMLQHPVRWQIWQWRFCGG